MMRKMRKSVFIDTSCLIVLSKINELNLPILLFGIVHITEEVHKEFGLPLPQGFELFKNKNNTYQKILEVSLDVGEASIIASALEIEGCLLVIDDAKGRKHAERLGIEITGTLGLIIAGKNVGIIASAKALLNKIKETDFRISQELEQTVLLLSGENT